MMEIAYFVDYKDKEIKSGSLKKKLNFNNTYEKCIIHKIVEICIIISVNK